MPTFSRLHSARIVSKLSDLIYCGLVRSCRPDTNAKLTETEDLVDIERLSKAIARIEADVTDRLGGLNGVDGVRSLETSVLGKKGSLGLLISAIKDYPPKERGQVGRSVNEAKIRVKNLFQRRMKELQAAAEAEEATAAAAFDPTLPGWRDQMGSVHPVTAVQWEIERAFELFVGL